MQSYLFLFNSRICVCITQSLLALSKWILQVLIECDHGSDCFHAPKLCFCFLVCLYFYHVSIMFQSLILQRGNLIFAIGLVSTCHRSRNQYNPSHALALVFDVYKCVCTCMCVCVRIHLYLCVQSATPATNLSCSQLCIPGIVVVDTTVACNINADFYCGWEEPETAFATVSEKTENKRRARETRRWGGRGKRRRESKAGRGEMVTNQRVDKDIKEPGEGRGQNSSWKTDFLEKERADTGQRR